MATRLKAIKYDRVALVDRGANPEAHVMLWKRHVEKGDAPGHEFRGNQWTGGIDGGGESSAARGPSGKETYPEMPIQGGTGKNSGLFTAEQSASGTRSGTVRTPDGERPFSTRLGGEYSSPAVTVGLGAGSSQVETYTLGRDGSWRASGVEDYSGSHSADPDGKDAFGRTFVDRGDPGRTAPIVDNETAYVLSLMLGFNQVQEYASHVGRETDLKTGYTTYPWSKRLLPEGSKFSKLKKGDLEGHEFRGNQYTGGQGGADAFDASLRAQGIDPGLLDTGPGEADRIGGTAILDVKAAADRITEVAGSTLQVEVRQLGSVGLEQQANQLQGIAIGLESQAREMEMAAITREAGRFDRAADETNNLVDDLFGLGNELRSEWPNDTGDALVIEGVGQGISSLMDNVRDTVGADRGPTAKRLLPPGSKFAKGDAPGHDFRGNQYTGGGGSSAEEGKPKVGDYLGDNSAGNTVNVGDKATVTSGPDKGVRGTVTGLARGGAFVLAVEGRSSNVLVLEDEFKVKKADYDLEKQGAQEGTREFTVAKLRARKAWRRSFPSRPLAEMPERLHKALDATDMALIVHKLATENRWGATRTRATIEDISKAAASCPDCGMKVKADATECPMCGAKMDAATSKALAKVGRKMSAARLARLQEVHGSIAELLAEVDNTPDPEGGLGMAKMDELLKELDDETKAEVEQMLAKAAEADQLAKDKAELETQLAEAKKAAGPEDEPAPEGDEALAKALEDPDLPDSTKDLLRKQAADAAADRSRAAELEKRVEEDIEKREIEAEIAKVSELKHLTIDPASFGVTLHHVTKNTGTPEHMAEIHRVLTSAEALLAQAGITEQIGKGGTQAPTDAMSELKDMAKSIQKDDTTLSFEQAFVKAQDTEDGRALVAKMREEN